MGFYGRFELVNEYQEAVSSGFIGNVDLHFFLKVWDHRDKFRFTARAKN